MQSAPTAESTDEGPVNDKSIAASAELSGLSHEIDIVVVDVVVGGADIDDDGIVFNTFVGFSTILSFELVNDAKFANSSLKLFDDKLRLDNVVDADAVLFNCVLIS